MLLTSRWSLFVVIYALEIPNLTLGWVLTCGSAHPFILYYSAALLGEQAAGTITQYTDTFSKYCVNQYPINAKCQAR